MRLLIWIGLLCTLFATPGVSEPVGLSPSPGSPYRDPHAPDSGVDQDRLAQLERNFDQYVGPVFGPDLEATAIVTYPRKLPPGFHNLRLHIIIREERVYLRLLIGMPEGAAFDRVRLRAGEEMVLWAFPPGERVNLFEGGGIYTKLSEGYAVDVHSGDTPGVVNVADVRRLLSGGDEITLEFFGVYYAKKTARKVELNMLRDTLEYYEMLGGR